MLHVLHTMTVPPCLEGYFQKLELSHEFLESFFCFVLICKSDEIPLAPGLWSHGLGSDKSFTRGCVAA